MAGKTTIADASDRPVDASYPFHVTTSTVGGGVTLTDKTITSLSGSSQTLMAANASRKAIVIKNGAAPVAINLLGGTAAIGGAGCITLAAYELVALEGQICPVGAITAIGTAANYLSAFEGA